MRVYKTINDNQFTGGLVTTKVGIKRMHPINTTDFDVGEISDVREYIGNYFLELKKERIEYV